MKRKLMTAITVCILAMYSSAGQNAGFPVTGNFQHSGIELSVTGLENNYTEGRYDLIQHKNSFDSKNIAELTLKGKKQKLDSIVYQSWDKNKGTWITKDKDEFFYDVNGYNITANSFQWNDTTKSWVGKNKNNYTYDGNGIIMQIHSYLWNEGIKQWEGYSRNDYSYDLNRNMTQNILYNWHKPTGKWAESKKSEYVYDSIGNIKQSIQYKSWDTILKQWIPDEKEEITYDTLGNHTLSVSYKYDETITQWNNNNKTEWVWNNKGILINYTSFKWDKIQGQWVNSGRAEYSIEEDKHKQVISYTWNTSDNQWVGVYKTDFTYDSKDQIILSLAYSWNKNSKLWVNSSKIETSYDINGKLAKESRYNWNSAGSKWIGSMQREYTYDAERNKILDIFYTWNATSGQWVISDKEEFTYDLTVASSDVFFGDEYFLATVNDTVFNKLTGSVAYVRDTGTDQLVFSYRKLLFYSPFIITGDTTKATICEGKTYSFVNKIYSKAGLYSDTLISSKGADSIVFLALSLHSSYLPEIEVRGDTLISPVAYSSYQWYTDAGIIPGATQSKFVISKSGKYHLVITDNNGCTNTSDAISVTWSDVKTAGYGDYLYSVIPNPNSGSFLLRINTVSPADLKIKLFDTNGQVIEERLIKPAGRNHTEHFDVSRLSKGIYFLNLSTGHKMMSEKIVIK